VAGRRLVNIPTLLHLHAISSSPTRTLFPPPLSN
jgi:hypothetical protein